MHPTPGQGAAIDLVDRAGKEGRILRGQEAHQLGDLLGPAEALNQVGAK